MCIQNSLQSKIAELTNNGDTVAVFLADTLSSPNPAIKIHHRLDAARMLSKYCIPQQNSITQFTSPAIEEEPALAKNAHQKAKSNGKDGSDQTEDTTHSVSSRSAEEEAEQSPSSTSTPTLRDIIAYPLARYIRDRTNNGDTLVTALQHIMEGGEYNPHPLTGETRETVKIHHKLAAAKEILRRALGEYPPTHSASISPDLSINENDSARAEPALGNLEETVEELEDHEQLNSDLAKLVRDRTNGGIDAAEILIRIAEDNHYEEGSKPSHRLSAAKELLRRAYDLNYDAVTWDHIDAYNRAKDTEISAADQDTELERTRIQNHRAKLIRKFKEASDADDEQAMQTAEDKYNAYNRRIRDGAHPDEALQYTEYGPNDSDPDANPYPPLTPQEQLEFDRYWKQYSAKLNRASRENPRLAAAAIHTPIPTITLNNRSP
jgi:hypothetical protein